MRGRPPQRVESLGLEDTRKWLREAERLRVRLEEAVSRERLLDRMPEAGPALERARGQQRAATSAWARAWAERARAIDQVPSGLLAAVLGYKYLQGMDMYWISIEIGCNLKSVYRYEARGVAWIRDHVNIKKEPR